MRSGLIAVLLSISIPLFACTARASEAAGADRVQLTLDTSEAEQVLAMLNLRKQGKRIPEADWQRLFTTAPYRRLKKREIEIGKRYNDATRAFTDNDFKNFIFSDDLLRRAPALAETLARWKKADLRADGIRVLDYLPADARIRAKVYPMIKPRANSFVFEVSSDPAIFLYLDPEMSREKFENVVTHELHHIGLGSVGPVYDTKIAALPEAAKKAATWMGAFGEGMAMLAAAGGPDIDPQAYSTAKDQARWKQDMSRFNDDLETVNRFFSDILNAKFANADAISEKGGSFFGIQGPWYTVGYKMSVMVEKRYGRATLISTMLDPRCLLVLYNRAATDQNAASKPALPLWSQDVLSGVQAGSCESH
jgi:hypothetical protein